MEIKITNIHVKYHRNGIGGEGFFTIHFLSTGDGSDKSYDGKLICIIIPGEDESKDKYKFTGQCYIIKPNRPDLCFRGDNFEPYMRDILRAYEYVWECEWKKSQKAGTFVTDITFKSMKDVTEIINGEKYK